MLRGWQFQWILLCPNLVFTSPSPGRLDASKLDRKLSSDMFVYVQIILLLDEGDKVTVVLLSLTITGATGELLSCFCSTPTWF